MIIKILHVKISIPIECKHVDSYLKKKGETMRSKHYHIRKCHKSHGHCPVNTFVNKSAKFVSPSSFMNHKMTSTAAS